MFKKYTNGEEYYNKIYLLFNLVIAISLAPFSYLLLLRQSGQLHSCIGNDLLKSTITIGLLISAVALIWYAIRNFKKGMELIDTKLPLRKQLNFYMNYSLRQYTSFLLSQTLCVFGLYITGSSFFVVGYVLSVIIQSIKRPTLNSIIENLGLSEKNQNILIEKKTIS